MEKKYSLPYKAEIGIVKLAEKCGIDKVILFGSRARGDNSRTSDIDIAVSGGQVYRFKCSVDDEVETLLMFDVVNLDDNAISHFSSSFIMPQLCASFIIILGEPVWASSYP